MGYEAGWRSQPHGIARSRGAAKGIAIPSGYPPFPSIEMDNRNLDGRPHHGPASFAALRLRVIPSLPEPVRDLHNEDVIGVLLEQGRGVA